LALEPENVINYLNVAVPYIFLDRLDDSDATSHQSLAHNLDDGSLRQAMYLVAFLRGDAKGMAQQLAWGAGKPGDEDPLLSMQSDAEAYYGRLSTARDFSRRAVDSATRADSKEEAAFWQANAALRESEVGNAAAARQGARAALELSPGRDVKVFVALTLARVGDTHAARELGAELEKDYSTNFMLKHFDLPIINAGIELNEGNPSQALLLSLA
jgi:eukaryotic-like serine/threonine-protein kinase